MYINKSIISKYTSYFHDGTLFDIQHGKDSSKLILVMESCYIDKEDLKDHISCSKEDTLRGKLHLKGVKNIYTNHEKLSTPLKMNYDNGKIFDLEIKNNEVLLAISWRNYPPKARTNDFSTITIDVENVSWENIPDLEM